jgi:hypothetical protein
MSSLTSVNPFFASADDVKAFVHNDTVLALCAEAYETILPGYEILMTSQYAAEELRGEAEMLAGEETLVTYMAKELTVRDGASRPWMALATLVDDMRSGEPEKLIRAAAVLSYFGDRYNFDDALAEVDLDAEEREYFCALFCGVTPSVYAIVIALVYKAAEMLNDTAAFDALLDKYPLKNSVPS